MLFLVMGLFVTYLLEVLCLMWRVTYEEAINCTNNVLQILIKDLIQYS